jgi:Tfp pilus assembly protein FimV
MTTKNITTAEAIIASISDMKVSSQKAYITKNINQQADYIKTIEDKFYNRQWKHYYGEPLNEEVILNEIAQLEELVGAKALLNGEDWQKVSAKKSAKAVKSKAVVSETPKPTASETALAELTKSMTNLTSQLTELTKVVVKNSVDIASIQKQIETINQPKVTKVTTPVRKSQPKAVASKKAEIIEDKPAIKKTSKSLLEELFGSFRTVKADKPKSTKPSRKEYNPYGNSYKAKKMAYMEVR